MTKAITSLFMLSMMFAIAQTKIDETLQSIPIRENLNVYLGDDSLRFTIDSGEDQNLPKNSFLVAKRVNSIKLTSQFFNPLKYRIVLQQEEKDDPVFVAADEVLNSSIYPTLSQVGFGNIIGALKNQSDMSIASKITTNNKVKLKKKEQRLINYSITNPELAELYAFLKIFDPKFETKAENEKYLKAMQDFSIADVVSEIEQSTKALFANLLAISSFKEKELKIATNDGLLKTIEADTILLEKDYIKLETQLIDLKNLLSNKHTSLAVIIDQKLKIIRNQISDVKKITTSSISHYEVLKSPFLKLKENKNRKPNEILNEMFLVDVDIPARRKLNEVVLKLVSYEFDNNSKTLTEKETKIYTIVFRRYSFLVPRVSSGVLYTDLSFPTFGTTLDEEGNTVISQGEDNDSELSIATYLDFHFNSLNELPIFLQLGVGPSREKPLLFTGIGIDLIDRINLSFGGIFTWFPELNDLNIGDQVSGTTEINDDITFRFSGKPRFYLGLSVDLSKKGK